MAVKKTRMTLLAAAVTVAQQILANEEVRRRLAEAPKYVIDWATERRAALRATSAGRFNPSTRFGQKGLERRVDSIVDAIGLAFPSTTDPGRAELMQATDRLRVALAVAKPLPLVKRKRAHARIDKELDALESALVDAVLPKPGKSPEWSSI